MYITILLFALLTVYLYIYLCFLFFIIFLHLQFVIHQFETKIKVPLHIPATIPSFLLDNETAICGLSHTAHIARYANM